MTPRPTGNNDPVVTRSLLGTYGVALTALWVSAFLAGGGEAVARYDTCPPTTWSIFGAEWSGLPDACNAVARRDDGVAVAAEHRL